MWAFNLRLLFRVADYRYFRELAEFMKMKVPLINHEIQIAQSTSCLVHGLKRIEYDPHQTQGSQDGQEGKTESVVSKVSAFPQGEVDPIQPQFTFEQHSKVTLSFGQALSASKALELDLCLVRTATPAFSPILSVSPVCKAIYSEYYQTHLKKRGKGAHKTIRFTERINENDMLTKYNNVERLRGEGERRFRLEATTDTSKAERVLMRFGELFGKRVEPQLRAVRVPGGRKDVERWSCMLVFDEEVQIDTQRVNKKWRRRKISQSQRVFQEEEGEDLLDSQQRIEVQRQLYQTYKQLNLKMPPKYQSIADLEEKLKTDKHAIYREALLDPSDQLQYEWDDEEERRYQQKQARFNQQFFGERALEQIISEMEALKESGYESEAFRVARFRQLKAELDALTRRTDLGL